MKKLMCAILCVVLIFSMAACGNGRDSGSGAGGSSQNTRKEVDQIPTPIVSKDRNELSVREFATAKRNNDIIRLRQLLQTNIPVSRMLKSRISKLKP